MHKWVMSFDLNSLYPHLIMQYNLSPETLVSGEFIKDLNVDTVLKGVNFNLPDNTTITPNGALYRKDIKGFYQR